MGNVHVAGDPMGINQNGGSAAMAWIITSYSGTTLVLEVYETNGSGAHSSCYINPFAVWKSDNASTGATPTWAQSGP